LFMRVRCAQFSQPSKQLSPPTLQNELPKKKCETIDRLVAFCVEVCRRLWFDYFDRSVQ
jgi:hypothetical protein